MPDSSALKNALVAEIPLGAWLDALNRRVREYVGRDARNLQIGHSYLMEKGVPITDFVTFSRILREDILPLLEEYCYEDYAKLALVLENTGLVDTEEQRIRDELFEPAHKDELKNGLLALDPALSTRVDAIKATQKEQELEDSNHKDDDIDASNAE